MNEQIDSVSGPSTAATAHATSTPWWPLRHEPRRSSSCRAQQVAQQGPLSQLDIDREATARILST